MTAIMLSSSVPMIFSAGSYEGVPYVDGGLSNNFPLVSLLEHPSNPDPSTVLCIHMTGPVPNYKIGAPLIEMMTYIVVNAIMQMSNFNANHTMGKKTCEHYVFSDSKSVWSKTLWDQFLYSEDERRLLHERGLELARAHLSKVAAKEPLKEDTPPC